MKKLNALMLFGVFASGTLLLQADDHDHDKDKRFYDRTHKDYHGWNDDENRAWTHYAETQHYKVNDWNRANRKQQEGYWKWRHEHSGNDWDRH